jgi:RHS repeat-associated protein
MRAGTRGALGALALSVALTQAPAAIAAGAPDLSVVSVSNRAGPSATGTLAVRVGVRNGGNRRAPRFTLAVFLSADRKLDRSDALLGRRFVKALRPAGRDTAARAFAIPAPVKPGIYYLIACADDRRRLRERNERNNCRTSGTRLTVGRSTPAPGPDPAPTPTPLTPAPNATATPTPAPSATPTPSPTPSATPPPGGPSDPAAADPAAAAPNISAAAATSLAAATSFLYSGADPIQKGVAAGTIESRRVAILRGRVRNRMGAAIGGIRVTVLDHPELGRTATRDDGGFDMAVNGGGPLVLRYERNGYVTAQRQVDAPWSDYATVDDVVMIPYDDQVTEVDLSSATAFQLARASAVTDGDGTRRATMLFSAGTDASMVMPDGSTRPLGVLHVRATEYTIGASGPDAMPGPLPAASGYTYATELSVDEAVEAGASEVRFTKPVITYVENFVGFPVGGPVPAGYLDRTRGVWVAAPNGRVIEIVSETAGLADLGGAAGLGITDEERGRLAELYDPGQSLWRVPLSHFTPWDFNWPYGPPPDAIPPNPPAPFENRPKPKKECFGSGSIIGCQSQRLGEAVAVAGTPFTLDYWSDRTPGRLDDRTLEIPITGASVPASLAEILLEVHVAGRVFRHSFGPAPNLQHAFTWDGRDAYGRILQGAQPVTIRLGYRYGFVQYSEPAAFAASFSRLSWNGLTASADRARKEMILWQQYSDQVAGTLGGWDARGQALGGWTLDAHQAYDPYRRTVFLGGGGTVDAESVITTAAGTGQPFAFHDGVQATQARLGYANDVAVAADGSVYVAEITARDAGLLSRIRKDGVIEYVSGHGFSSAEGVPAAQASLGSLRGIAVGPDSSVYVAEANRGRVRRIDPQGIIRTFAGGGGQGVADGRLATDVDLGLVDEVAVAPDGGVYLATGHLVRHVGLDGLITTAAGGGAPATGVGDGGPATGAVLGHVDGLAVSRAGELYIGGSGAEGRVRRVDLGGRISTVAGGGDPANGPGDGGPGTAAALGSLYGMDFALDGSLYFTERREANYVRRLAPDGTLTTLAGRLGPCCSAPSSGDHGPPGGAGLGEIVGVAVGPDGAWYMATHGDVNFSGRVRRVSRPQPVEVGGSGLIPSRDGKQAYEFDGAGRHLRTFDGLTGALLLRFSYDAAGRLGSIADADGNTTAVERDGGGAPTAIVAPGGQRTELHVGAEGWLDRISKPESQVTSMLYAPTGLMTELTDPRGGVHRFEHDPAGRLTRDEDPALGVQTLSRVASAAGYTVTRTTALGRASTFSVQRRDTGGVRVVTTDPSGAATTVDSLPDGRQTAAYADGEQVDLETGPDPRWDYAVPNIVSMKVTTPAGLIETTTHAGAATLSAAADPFSVVTLTDTTTSNGRTTTTVYDAATRKLTRTSPEGRKRVTLLDARARVTRVEPGAGLDPVTYAYDARGLASGVTQGPNGWTLERDARLRVSARVDALGARTTFAHDDADRVTAMTVPGGGVYGFGYDRNGNRTGVTMPDGDAHALGYSAGDRLDRFTPAGSATSQTRTYDADHDLKTTTLPGGREIERGYDAGGRPTSVAYLEATAAIAYVGDTARPRRFDWTPAGGGADQSLTYAYDADLPTRATYSGTAAGEFEYRYDANRRLSGIKLTSGASVVDSPVTRDGDGLATGLGPFAFQRNGPDAAVSRIADSALALTLSHDGRGRAASRSVTVAGQPVYGAVLTRDAAGRVTRRVETVAGVATTSDYGYDADGRLVQVDRGGGPVERYAYDANGNRTSRRLGAAAAELLTYDGQERLATRGTTSYGFGADGFLSGRGVQTFTYSARGELLLAGAVSYVYDGLGRRTGRTQGADTTEYLYGNPGDPLQVTAVRAPSGALSTYYYDEDGLLYALQRGGSFYYVATDQAGSPRVVTDATGAVVKSLAYDSFGVLTSDSDPGFELPFGFAGGIADPVTGLVHFGFRDYEPESGRWTARDPVLFHGGQANLYVYAGGDPIGQRDPSGLACIGGSVYAVFGGGGSLCITDEGLSLCAEAGLGFGTGADIDPTGDLAEDGTSVLAEASAKWGPLGGKIGIELDSTGCLSGGPEAELGPVKITADDITVKADVDIEIAARDTLLKSGKASVQAKVAAKVCGQLPF